MAGYLWFYVGQMRALAIGGLRAEKEKREMERAAQGPAGEPNS